jgi:hypothetical protein
MTDSSGYNITNTHNGNTFIDGSLTIDGQIFVRDAEGQSEYLDSGDYNPTVLGVTSQWESLILKSGTQARYAKNGNIVEVYMELTGSLKENKSFAQISVSVPSVDLFDKKHIGSAYSDSVFILANSAQVYNCTGAFINTSGAGNTSVLLNYDSYIPTNPASIVDFFLNITYKLEGEDVPASAIIQGGGGSGGDVRNPMIEPLNGGGFDILNVGNVQATTFNGGAILNNPLSIDLDSNNKNISNVNNLDAELIRVDRLYSKLPGNAINVFNDMVFNENKIFQLASINNSGLTFSVNSTFITLNGSTTCGGDIDMDSNKLTRAGEVTTDLLQSYAIANPNLGSPIIFNSEIETNNLPINLNGSSINNCSLISNNSNIDIKTTTASASIKIAPTVSGTVELSTPSGQAKVQGSIINFVSGGTIETITSIQKQTLCNRIEHSASPAVKIDTVHIFATSGFTEPNINIDGNDYYLLKDNCTYVIHDQITVSKGFNFGDNTSIRGQSVASSITFNESTKDICGFRSDNQHLFLSDVTVIGGGGHFTSSIANVKGLIDFSNFNTGASAPFYGRNKRCRIQNVQIIAPYSLGKLQGGGTLRLLGNFINGGGAQPTGIYTRVGLEVSDGLSFEFCNNKVVLMAGAQTSSTMKMLDFVDATLTPVVLGFNAVIISGNIFHPRDQENAINFQNNSITQLGTIGSNTFIRSGGTAPLINYERATLQDNYNKSAVINYEVNANAGVLDVLPTCLINGITSNSLSSATYIDITFPVGNIQKLKGTKRFGLKTFISGATGGNYTTGNYIRDTTNPNKYAYILEATTILGGTDELILVDFNEVFTSATTYEEVDKDFVLTGVTSTSFNFGTLNNELEIYYADKDPADLQIVASITHNNTTINS